VPFGDLDEAVLVMRALDHGRPGKCDAEPMSCRIEHQIVILEAPVLRAWPVIDALGRKPGAPGGRVRIVNEGMIEEPLWRAGTDVARQSRRGDRITPLLEELHRDAVGNTAAAAANGKIGTFRFEIDMAMFHGELDAQDGIATLESDQPLHQPQAADRGN